jgi:hypothetical protein
MKTPCIASKNFHHRFLLIAVIVAFTCLGCEKENPIPELVDAPEAIEGVVTEYFRVLPAGNTVHLFGGSVMLDFPPGTLASPTRFSVVSFPLDDLRLRENNLMLRGFSMTNITNDNKFEKPVKIFIRYDLAEYNDCCPEDENNLTIYRFYGDMFAFHKIECIGECCVDCSCKIISGCIYECGSYTVGQN